MMQIPLTNVYVDILYLFRKIIVRLSIESLETLNIFVSKPRQRIEIILSCRSRSGKFPKFYWRMSYQKRT